MTKEPSHDEKILARLLFQQSTSYTDNDCTPLFSALHPVPKRTWLGDLIIWFKVKFIRPKLTKTNYEKTN